MQYIPLEKTLGAILLNEEYTYIFQDFAVRAKLDSDNICHFFRTITYRNHPFSQQYPAGLALHLYIDAFETTNVLGSHTGVHKMEGLYLTIQNFPPEMQSKLSSIYLVALWHAQDVKTYGYDRILDPVLKSLLQLESDNGALVLINGQTILVKAALVLFSADNLGFNSLFGFTERFTATRFCRFCECTREETDRFFQRI